MSYVIHVWEAPVPSSLEQADEILGVLLEETATRKRPKLAAFVKALWERYPRDPDTDPRDPVWSDDSLSQGYDGLPVVSLGIVSAHLDEVVAVIARTVMEFGLVAFDLQYATVYLPSGQVLGNRPSSSAAKSRSMSCAEVTGALARAMSPSMEALGFKLRRSRDATGFVGAFKGGEHQLTLLSFDESPCVTVDLVAETQLDWVDEVVNTVVHPGSKHRHAAVSSWLGRLLPVLDPGLVAKLPMHAGEHLLVRSLDEIPSLARELVSFFRDRVFPLIRRCETAQGVWQNYLSGAESAGRPLLEGSIYGDVIAGRLAGDPRYEVPAEAHLAVLTQLLEEGRAKAGPLFHPRMVQSREADLQRYGQFVVHVRTRLQPLAVS